MGSDREIHGLLRKILRARRPPHPAAGARAGVTCDGPRDVRGTSGIPAAGCVREGLNETLIITRRRISRGRRIQKTTIPRSTGAMVLVIWYEHATALSSGQPVARVPDRSPRKPCREGYTSDILGRMSKILVSLPDDLLERIDREAQARGSTRSRFLQEAALRQLGWPSPRALEAALERGRAALTGAGSFESADLVRTQRQARDARDRRR